ncbi:MAG: glycoside hydrolase family 13 protein [Ruminococcaceae bacterium]|nr:glycoside hydrolase family 13 protein [Oscillospiraceae bacterium]
MIPDQLKKLVKITKSAKKTKHADILGAFPEDDILTVKLTVPRALGISSPVFELYADDTAEKTFTPLAWGSLTGDCEVYYIDIVLTKLCQSAHSGLFFWSIVSDSAFGKLRFSCDPYSYSPKITPENCDHDSYVLTVYEKNYSTPEWIKGGVMYHIFVDRFAKGGDVTLRSDAIMNEDWDNYMPQYAKIPGGEVANNMFFGGTLYGIASKLDYLASLGVNCLYLSPIFEAYSNHKYDTGDYEKVDDMFGGDEALDLLIEEARSRGIRIILDGVFNHTGDDSKYFNRRGRYDALGAYNSPDSEYFKWYTFKNYPDKYRCWWDIKILPAVDSRNPEYNEYINGKNGIIAKYLNKGTHGWRLDVADELSEPFLEDLRRSAKNADPESIIIGEVWEDASIKIAYTDRRKYFRGKQLDSVMNYPLRTGIIDFITTGDSKNLFSASAGLYMRYPKSVSDCLMNFLGTHDTERILTVLGVGVPDLTMDEKAEFSMSPEEREKALVLIRLAYIILAFMPGVPCIFYGDEAGIEGLGDPFNRVTFPWGREDKELTEFYREIGQIRRRSDICKDGYLSVSEDLPDGVFEFSRFNNSGKAVSIIVNRSDKPYEHKKHTKNLVANLFGIGEKASVLPPMTAGVWEK